ncbi:MAG: radical SAM protein [Muribaculum sp.]|nr:radical SAM protein [Muribaculum sp.]
MQREDSNPEYIKVTILPTLQCNLRCWYCYENHNNSSKLNDETSSRINLLIKRISSQESLKKVNIDFFGGEPLMFFDETVAPIIRYANTICRENKKRLGVSFTTNGTLLTDNVCRELADTHADVSFQITLDGDREHHNKVRHLFGNIPTYDLIISNIIRAVKHKFYVSVRFNYTHNNYNTYHSVISDFDKLTKEEKERLDFSFHKVWQETLSYEMEHTISETINQYSKLGYIVNIPNSMGNKDRCYADSPNNIVINYNGDIYKCTAREFSPDTREGYLRHDGIIEWNQRYSQRMKLIYGIPVCQQCEIFPLCNCTCSQNRIEYESGSDSCPFGYSHDKKEYIVRERVYALLSSNIMSQKFNKQV